MKRKTDYITEYQNGNITIRYGKDMFEEALKYPVYVLSEVLFWMDCYIELDVSTHLLIHNVRRDMWYRLWRFPHDELDDLSKGKLVRLTKLSKKDVAWEFE